LLIVTGSSGPLGHAFRYLPDPSDFILSDSTHCDLTDRDGTERYLTKLTRQYGISAIVHLAAKSGGVSLNQTSPADLITENLEMAMNILKAARKVKITRVILAMSTACYASQFSNPKEFQILEGEISTNDYAYAYAKRMFVPLMHAFNSQYSMRITCSVINGVIGPNMNFKDGESTLVPALIKRIYNERYSDQPITVWGDGSPLREYTSSEDLARILSWSINGQEVDTVMNIGNTQKISVREVAETICSSFGVSVDRLQFDTSKPNGRAIQSTDNSLFINKSNFRYVDTKDAIAAACRWFEEAIKGGSVLRI